MFKNRLEAGAKLAQKIQADLSSLPPSKTLLVSIPRGGVVTGKAIAQTLRCQHDIVVVRKLQTPGNQELAFGAIGRLPGSLYLNQKLITDLNLNQNYINQEIARQQIEVERRRQTYRGSQNLPVISNRHVLIVDDGAATGASMIAAAREIWEQKPKQVIIAVPVLPLDTFHLLEKEADAVVSLEIPELFYAVSQYYEDYPQVIDQEVIQLLKDNSL